MLRKISIVKFSRPRLLHMATVGLLALFMSLPVGLATTAAMPVPGPPVIVAAGAVDKCKGEFFGLVPWYNYLDAEMDATTCEIKCFNVFPQRAPNDCGKQQSDIPGILLAIIDDLLRIAGIVAIAFVIVGAFQYVESRDNSERAARAQSSILNALIGLAVAMIAVGFISFLGSRLGG